jgi:hypothetical protein
MEVSLQGFFPQEINCYAASLITDPRTINRLAATSKYYYNILHNCITILQ